MQSIGERLEEARKRKGISLREAAEATKIRSDFLGYIEQNKMDFDLPEIYKSGFLKNYARYLKLDHDKIMTDYNAQELSKSRLSKRGGSEWFGQMEVEKTAGEESLDHSNSEEQLSYGRITSKPPRSEPAESNGSGDEADKTYYMKIGLVFVGTLALVFVVFGLIWAILGSSSDDTSKSPELVDSSEITQPADPTPTIDAPAFIAARQSSAVDKPPQPIMGLSVIVFRARMHLSAVGRTPPPDIPPIPLLRTGWP